MLDFTHFDFITLTFDLVTHSNIDAPITWERGEVGTKCGYLQDPIDDAVTTVPTPN